MATPLEGTDRASNKLTRVRYTHDAMIDLMLQRPDVSQNELALQFGFTVPWVSTVVNSDAFQARLAARKTELVDPVIIKELDERISELANISLSVVQEKLLASRNPDLAIKTLELTTKALGFGARPEKNATINQSFVVMMPQKTADADEWAADARKAAVVDVPVKVVS